MARTSADESPATLVAIIIAARRAGDRELEREAREQLKERFGVNLQFARRQSERGVPHAK